MRASTFLGAEQARLDELVADERLRIILTGAGSSHFIGDCLAAAIGKSTGRATLSLESTEIVCQPELLRSAGPLLIVSFARSGDSPESMGVYRLAERVAPQAYHIVITCNVEGALARAAAADGHACLLLDPRTNDRGLAMTSSFTNMLLAGLGLAYLQRRQDYCALSALLVRAGEKLLRDAPKIAKDLAALDFDRAVFLGSGALLGAARETSLKMLEMTNGAIASIAQSCLSLRHGPLSFVTDTTILIAFRSGDAYVRLYERDLLRQLAGRGLSGRLLLVEPQAPAGESEGLRLALAEEANAMPDAWLSALAVIVGQNLALFASLQRGCKPDEPSPSGLIHRVVEGVTMHDAEWPANQA